MSPIKPQLIDITRGVDLLAPLSLHWEIGNAFSAMMKRQRINLEQALVALRVYEQIPLRLVDIPLQTALIGWAAQCICLRCIYYRVCATISLSAGLT